MDNTMVDHPPHYTDGGIETIDYIEKYCLSYHIGNAVKYIFRAGKKDVSKTKEDLEKAKWYIKRYMTNPMNHIYYNDSTKTSDILHKTFIDKKKINPLLANCLDTLIRIPYTDLEKTKILCDEAIEYINEYEHNID